MFETRADMRAFLAGIACRVRAGDLELHAYCVMGTHFHLLVRSPRGRLAEAMQRIQLAYSRYFNRGRRRDGSLVRGRYRSKPVTSLAYRRALVAYIDANPVRARLVSNSAEYSFGSAQHHAREAGPPWLERSWVESEVRRATGSLTYDPRDYEAVFRRRSESLERVVDARIRCASRGDPLDDLVGGSPPSVLAWMRRKAALADGTAPGMPVCATADVIRLADARARAGPWLVRGSAGRERDGWEVAEVGLSVELTGATRLALAERLGCSATRISVLVGLHRELVRGDARYAERVSGMIAELTREWAILRR